MRAPAPAPSSETRARDLGQAFRRLEPGPTTSPSSRRTPSRITPVDCATADAAPFNASAVWRDRGELARHPLDRLDERPARSVMVTAVASWLANVVIVNGSWRR